MNNKKISRRNFIKSVVGTGLLFAGGNVFTGCGDKNTDTEPKDNKINDLEIKNLRQVITTDSSNTRCIMWQSDDLLINPTFEFKLKDTNDIQTLTVENTTFTDDDHINNQYTVHVGDLIVGAYEYRIADGEHCSDWHEFKVTDSKHLKALIFPDSQCADYNVWRKVANYAYKRNEDAAFFVNVGDIVDNGEDWTQWQAWFNGVNDFSDKIPFVPIMGNHETYNRQWKVRLPEAYLKYFDVPSNDSEKFERRYYSFDYGDVHFVVLDSQWQELDEVSEGYGSELINEQKAWLRQDILSSSKKWKIVFIHKDVLQYRINGRPERYEGFSDIGTEFMPLFDELKIDIVFTAHLHTYRDRGHIYNFERNPQGPLYILTGVAGDVRYPNLWIDHALDEVIAPQPETDNFLTLEVNENKIDVYCFLPDGTEIDHVNVVHIEGES